MSPVTRIGCAALASGTIAAAWPSCSPWPARWRRPKCRPRGRSLSSARLVKKVSAICVESRRSIRTRLREQSHRFVSVDGDGYAITNVGIGSRRYRVTFRGPGGHSYDNFGRANPVNALGLAIARLCRDSKYPSCHARRFRWENRRWDFHQFDSERGMDGGGPSSGTRRPSSNSMPDFRRRCVRRLKRKTAAARVTMH